MNIKKELLDQSLHFGFGLALTLLLAQSLYVLSAAGIVAIGAYLREVYQRISKSNPWCQCGSGCMLDLAFWALGIVTAILISIFVL